MTAPTRTPAHSGRNHPRRSTSSKARAKAGTAPVRATSRRQAEPARALVKKPSPHQPATRSAAQRGRGTAAQKAYARRTQRSEALRVGAAVPAGSLAKDLARMLRLPSSRAGFVLMLMGLLVVGVGLTMWLSTQAIADSYRLESVRAETAQLAERAERLQQDVTRRQTASALAAKARALGMVPSGTPAHLLVSPNGKVKLFGEPTRAQPRPQPAPPAESSQQTRPPSRTTPPRESTGDDTARREESRTPTEHRQVRAAADRSDDDPGGAEGTAGER